MTLARENKNEKRKERKLVITMVKLSHSKTTGVIQVVNTIIVLILVLLCSQVNNRATPQTADSEKTEYI